MANVLPPQINFHTRPVSHAPSPFGFGFGLGSNISSMSTGWTPSTPGHTNPAAFHQLATSVTQTASTRLQKRRLDPEDDSESSSSHQTQINRDESMDRSPTPERLKRAAPKRPRILSTIESGTKDEGTEKENKAPGSTADEDVDIGVLLASLPPQSLLPLLSSLLKVQPALKSTILPLIPRPTLETAIQALAQSAKRLREAYPYSNPPAFSQAVPSFGSTTRPSEQPAFGQSAHGNHSGMRDAYIISRLRPHVNDFVSSCMSYLPYFTCVPSSTQLSSLIPSTSQSHLATTIQSLHKDKFHPSETFLFLSAVTKHLIEQPPLTLSQLSPLILGRLSEDWKMWVDKVDELVNRQGGMFGSETVRSWERGLDEMAAADALEVSNEMRAIRDSWVSKVGWLVGRTVVQHMDEI